MPTSLLQFNGKIDKRGVQLQFVLVGEGRLCRYDDIEYISYSLAKPIDTFDDCPICGKTHSHIYLAYRKPAGVFGHWVVFRYLGEEHVPDLSIPIRVPRPPRGSVRCDELESARIWHG